FKMLDRGIPRHDYEIQDGSGRTIGRVTSGTMSPTLSQGIGLGYVETQSSSPGTEVFIAVRNKKLKAQVQKLPLI
ncbi:MAG: glycine cleavage system aminomethyltransferase GcvT, partial [Cytophagales bacterium]|nr:glycine cleavage system aminomethyltransferase GcvT [Cytophagales bacterium]